MLGGKILRGDAVYNLGFRAEVYGSVLQCLQGDPGNQRYGLQ